MTVMVVSVALVGCVAAIGLAFDRARWNPEYRERLVAVLALLDLLDHAPNASVAALAGHQLIPLWRAAPDIRGRAGAVDATTDDRT